MSASPVVRGLRAAVFAAVCVLLAAAGHGLAMGDMPPLWADAGGFLAVFALGCALGGRERSLAGIGAAMLGTQAGLHLAFRAAHRGSTPDSSSRTASTPGHTMTAMQAHMAHLAHAHPVHLHTVAHPTATGHATVAHLVAALAAAWWLRRGEAALWSLLRRAGTLVPGLLAWWRDAPLPAPAASAPRAPAGPAPPRRTPLRHVVHRRGPPAPIPYSA
ncbi:hypothetical protein SAMN05428944_1627 [Streptomyces sp. 1222.5]|uniref:hypothetical protein n=1 Tax=unclassified Streptomyces TaxID=2593676 RepID=UPI000894FEF8|nr:MULTISPECIES: hypothetical protein [unclassified Streptomyces]PKW11159.1 hypothetical protein BX260_6465 [Streptomyces sp. 5112.2]SEB86536.1 hypothetical protein SAMN05428944_1627 [Streptomyces sp. 1222.5]